MLRERRNEGGRGRERGKTKKVGRAIGKDEGWKEERKEGRMDRGRLIDVRPDGRKEEGGRKEGKKGGSDDER